MAPILQGVDDTDIYVFNDRSRLAVPGWLITKRLEECNQGLSSFTLTNGVTATCNNGTLYITVDDARIEVQHPIRSDVWYWIDNVNKVLRPLEVRGESGYVRLHSPEPGPPTLLVNGIVMHRVRGGWDPLRDARVKISLLRPRPGDTVLDTCMGLGYTAIAAARRGAQVITVEISRPVLALAEYNPYSKGLLSRNIHILNADVRVVAERLPSSFFDRVMHDPPRFNAAGELYSKRFYSELFRILKPGGILVHYTGEPQRSRGRGHGPIVRGVMERLREVGFRVLGFREKALSVIAVKPR